MQIWEKCFYEHRQIEEQPSRRSKKKCDKKLAASENRETCFGRLLIKYTTIGLRISGYGAAKVYIDFAEELKHTETNLMCKIHRSRRTSR